MLLPHERNDLYVSIDGKLMAADCAAVSVWDHGFLYGDGVFEGMRVRDGLLYQAHAHMARLAASAQTLGIALPTTPVNILDSVVSLIARNMLDNCYVRVIVTRGMGAPGIDPTSCTSSSCVILTYPQPPSLGTGPLRLLTSSVVRKAPRSIGAHVKSLNYLDSILAKLQAKSASMDDAIMLDDHGLVAEATGANVFLVMRGVLHTPTTIAALPGITRRSVMELAGTSGLRVVERSIPPMELYVADEVFLTGTAAGIVPVAAIDGRSLPTDRPIGDRIRQAYDADVRNPDRGLAISPDGGWSR